MTGVGDTHITVLPEAAIDAVMVDRDGYYVDCTFGRGGHTARLLGLLSAQGRVLALDKDEQACRFGRERFRDEARLELVQASFAELDELLAARGVSGQVSGILFDLGVSSPQLDDPERGFSFLRDGPLDMRMDRSRGPSVAEWLARAEERDIARVLKDYGEEKFARRMARAIVAARCSAPLQRTGELAEIIAAANPAWETGKHPATRAFQALRIMINGELEDLREVLTQVVGQLRTGGRLVVISFHSLEDRIVKRFMRDQARPPVPRGLPVAERDIPRHLRLVGKAQKPSAAEIDANPRARSAVMRVAEKVA